MWAGTGSLCWNLLLDNMSISASEAPKASLLPPDPSVC